MVHKQKVSKCTCEWCGKEFRQHGVKGTIPVCYKCREGYFRELENKRAFQPPLYNGRKHAH